MKSKHEHTTAFYIETILLIVSFVAVILVLTNVFGLGKLESAKARDLTNAVRLAESSAECFAAAEGPAELTDLLGGEPLVTLASASSQYPVPPRDRLPAMIFACYDKDLVLVPEEGSYYWVSIAWTPEKTNAPGDSTLAKGVISVYRTGETEGEPIYSLETKVYIGEEGQ
ncbi:MAG: hypothetical protein J6X24_00040 [Firmicutes bacterium]|nr:hypothetical protein [Bacillota bacterium]